MTPRIQKAIDIFLDALNNNTLAKGTCVACAVGNLVADGLKTKILVYNYSSGKVDFIPSDVNLPNSIWSKLFYTTQDRNGISEQFQDFELKGAPEEFRTQVFKAVSSTDFSIKELAQIEFAFESNTKIIFNEYHHLSKEEVKEDQIKGLEAVVKVMLSFDQQIDKVEEVFTKKAEKLVLKLV